MSRMAPDRPLRRTLSQCFAIVLVSVSGVLAGCFDGDGKDKNPVPVLSSVSPAATTVGSAALTLTATGSKFVSGSTVQWNGAVRTTSFVSSTQLTAVIPATDLASAGTAQVTVVNPAPGGGTSAAVTFTIQNPVPILSLLSPDHALAGSPGFDLTVVGGYFVSGATVQWNGAARATTFVSSNILSAAISAADVAAVGTATVHVVNPAPGGGASAALTFTIQAVAPVPIITALGPAGLPAGSPDFDLYVTGSGFVQGSTVTWNGADRVTTFISASQVVAAITAADVVSPGAFAVAVRNPAPGGTSNSLYFVVSASGTSGRLLPVAIAPDGSPPNGPSVNGGMSWEGRYAFFASKASNLVPGDTNGAWDVFVRDTCFDPFGLEVPGCVPTTTRLSVAADGSQADGDSGATTTSPTNGLVVSFGGRYIAFVSAATNLVADDTNGVDDVFVRDTCLEARTACTPRTVRVSLHDDGSQSTAPASAPAIGDNGDHVAFVSADAAMVPGDANGVADVFLRDVCYGSVVGCTPGTRRISVAPGNADSNGASGSPAFTGRYLAFVSSASNLVADDTNGVADVFLRDTCIGAEDACTPGTERISVGSVGVQGNGPSSEPLVGLPMSSFSGDDYHGRFVVFVSQASNLVTGDTNGVADVFRRDTCRGQMGCVPSTRRASVTSANQQIVGQPSLHPGHIRWDGSNIMFATAANGVVPNDTNNLTDVFITSVCENEPNCVNVTRLLSVGEDGLLGNAASDFPRGNHDAWAGPSYATFFSEATNFWPGEVPMPYYGSIFRGPTR